MSAGHKEDEIKLNLNGKEIVWNGEPTALLADVIRSHDELTGTKIGCRTGECGACTVLLDGSPVVSCLIPVASVQGQQIETIEGLSQKAEFQSLALSMQENGGVQCGFCTPGVMVTVWAWLQNPALFDGDLGAALKNNLCRCTGYLGIIQAAEQVLAARGAAS